MYSSVRSIFIIVFKCAQRVNLDNYYHIILSYHHIILSSHHIIFLSYHAPLFLTSSLCTPLPHFLTMYLPFSLSHHISLLIIYVPSPQASSLCIPLLVPTFTPFLTCSPCLTSPPALRHHHIRRHCRGDNRSRDRGRNGPPQTSIQRRRC